jgi:hypothetical protein
VLGNPPFVGKKEQSKEQKFDLLNVCVDIKSAGILDFVAAWYIKAARYMAAGNSFPMQGEGGDGGVKVDTSVPLHLTPTPVLPLKEGGGIKAAFVSTNSITQGEQVGVLWSWMLAQGIKIYFAHRTFSWSNEARGKAAVHCVIVGFGMQDVPNKIIYEYEDIKGEPHAIKAANINPYLVDAPNLVLCNISNPILNMPKMIEGITPLDNGILSFTEGEYLQFVTKEPQSEKWFRRWITGQSFINGTKLYCLWMSDVTPDELRKMPSVMQLIEQVKEFRLNSSSSQKFAATPWLFRETVIPEEYLLIPKTSSENRRYVPIGFIKGDITSSSSLMLPDATLYHFGVMSSNLHMAWLRVVGGRLESRYRYSAGVVYNNFPWQESGEKQRESIEAAAQAVLDARAVHPNASLADMYDPLTMPANLLKAHQILDNAVDAAYGYKGASTDAARVAFLFERYQVITSLLPAVEKTRKTRKQ